MAAQRRAGDLAELVKALNLKDAVHVGHSTGGGDAMDHEDKGMMGVIEVVER
jgi:non-heme chloroperoxidase